MKFIQKKSDGSLKIKFSWKERFILFFRGNLYLNSFALRHFSNNLIKIITEWNVNFNEDVKKLTTSEEDSIQGK
jgi:hypothetical protein